MWRIRTLSHRCYDDPTRLKPSTLMAFHRALVNRKYRLLFAPRRRKPGLKGPGPELVTAIVEMKRRNPRFGCRRGAQQIAFTFGVEIDKDVVRRVLAIEGRHSGLLNRSQCARSGRLSVAISLSRAVSAA